MFIQTFDTTQNSAAIRNSPYVSAGTKVNLFPKKTNSTANSGRATATRESFGPVIFRPPAGSDAERYAVVAARHGTRQYRNIGLVVEIVNAELHRQIAETEPEQLLEYDVAHVIGAESGDHIGVVACGGKSFAVIDIFIDEREASPAETSDHVR